MYYRKDKSLKLLGFQLPEHDAKVFPTKPLYFEGNVIGVTCPAVSMGVFTFITDASIFPEFLFPLIKIL